MGMVEVCTSQEVAKANKHPLTPRTPGASGYTLTSMLLGIPKYRQIRSARGGEIGGADGAWSLRMEKQMESN